MFDRHWVVFHGDLSPIELKKELQGRRPDFTPTLLLPIVRLIHQPSSQVVDLSLRQPLLILARFARLKATQYRLFIMKYGN
jgi:hypothetical protein